MKVVILSQPFPQGNYRLNSYIANELKKRGFEVEVLPQLSSTKNDPRIPQYREFIKSKKPDILYYEMLDWASFKAVEEIDLPKILCFTSKGVLDYHKEILDKSYLWYTGIFTNSKYFYEQELDSKTLSKRKIHDYFEYYPAPVYEDELIRDPKYSYDICFVGQENGRLNDPDFGYVFKYLLETEDFNVGIFGTGWEGKNYKGLLPYNKIGSLYTSSKSAVNLIEKSQDSWGQINNRVSETFFCKCLPIFLNGRSFSDDEFFKNTEKFTDLKNKFSHILTRKNSYLRTLDKISRSVLIRQEENTFFKRLVDLINQNYELYS